MIKGLQSALYVNTFTSLLDITASNIINITKCYLFHSNSTSHLMSFQGHFKQLSEFYEEIGGKSTLFKQPMNYVLHYPQLDICVDTR